MAIKMVREPSVTPNINNIDDIVPMRYAYGNQDGYVISKGTEAAATVNGSSFTIGSGRIVVQGVECDIDANGITIVVDNIATKKYFSVYLKVNLGTNTVNIQSEDDTAAYPDIQRGDDLTHTSTGIAKLSLYTFEAQNGVISNVQKKIQAIEYSGTALADYDISKGTVEERLTKLGFSEDDIIDLDGNVVGHIKRQGNFVIGTLNSSFNQNRFGLLPEKYRPKSNETFVNDLVYFIGTNDKTKQIAIICYNDECLEEKYIKLFNGLIYEHPEEVEKILKDGTAKAREKAIGDHERDHGHKLGACRCACHHPVHCPSRFSVLSCGKDPELPSGQPLSAVHL